MKTVKAKQNRRIENIKKNKRKEIPIDLLEYEDCYALEERKFRELEPYADNNVKIGDIELDNDEITVLKLNPKFGAMKKLDKETTEAEIEVGLSKLRYEICQREMQQRREEIEFENSEGKKQKIERKTYEEQIIEDAKDRQVFDPLLKRLDLAKKRD